MPFNSRISALIVSVTGATDGERFKLLAIGIYSAHCDSFCGNHQFTDGSIKVSCIITGNVSCVCSGGVSGQIGGLIPVSIHCVAPANNDFHSGQLGVALITHFKIRLSSPGTAILPSDGGGGHSFPLILGALRVVVHVPKVCGFGGAPVNYCRDLWRVLSTRFLFNGFSSGAEGLMCV